MDDDYVYLLERFMNEDKSETSETSSYQQQMQLAIEKSIELYNKRDHYIDSSPNRKIFSNDDNNEVFLILLEDISFFVFKN